MAWASVRLSVRHCHTAVLCQNGASQDHEIFTVGCSNDSSFLWQNFVHLLSGFQARWEGGVGGGKLSRAPRCLGAPPSAKNIKYARMYHFEKKNSKIISPEEPRENVRGPATAARMFPRALLWLSTGLVGSPRTRASKRGIPLKRRYFAIIGWSSVKTVGDIYRHVA